MYLPARENALVHPLTNACHATDKRPRSKQSSKPNTWLIKLSSSKEERERVREREVRDALLRMCARHDVHVSGCPLAGRTDVWMDGWMDGWILDPSGLEGQVQQYDYDEQQDDPASNPLEAAPKQVEIERQTHRTCTHTYTHTHTPDRSTNSGIVRCALCSAVHMLVVVIPRRSPHSRPSVGVMSCGSRLGSSRRMPTYMHR